MSRAKRSKGGSHCSICYGTGRIIEDFQRREDDGMVHHLKGSLCLCPLGKMRGEMIELENEVGEG